MIVTVCHQVIGGHGIKWKFRAVRSQQWWSSIDFNSRPYNRSATTVLPVIIVTVSDVLHSPSKLKTQRALDARAEEMFRALQAMSDDVNTRQRWRLLIYRTHFLVNSLLLSDFLLQLVGLVEGWVLIALHRHHLLLDWVQRVRRHFVGLDALSKNERKSTTTMTMATRRTTRSSGALLDLQQQLKIQQSRAAAAVRRTGRRAAVAAGVPAHGWCQPRLPQELQPSNSAVRVYMNSLGRRVRRNVQHMKRRHCSAVIP